MKGKNYKGGYKIISLLGVSLADGESYTIAGIHKAIESSYRKPLLIEGIVVDGVEKDATWVKELKVVEGSFVIELYGLKLTITDEDEVTVEEIVEPTPTPIIIPINNVTKEHFENVKKQLMKSSFVNIGGIIGNAVTVVSDDYIAVTLISYVPGDESNELDTLESVTYNLEEDEVTVTLAEL